MLRLHSERNNLARILSTKTGSSIKTGSMLALLLVLFIIANSSFANDGKQTSNVVNQKTYQQVSLFLERYLEHFNSILKDSSDAQALQGSAEDMSYPAVWISNKGNRLIAAQPDFVKQRNAGFLNYLAQQNVQAIRWEKISLKRLGEKTVIASNVANLIDHAGNVTQRISSTYLLHLEQNQWRIFSRIQHPVEHRIKSLDYSKSYSN